MEEAGGRWAVVGFPGFSGANPCASHSPDRPDRSLPVFPASGLPGVAAAGVWKGESKAGGGK